MVAVREANNRHGRLDGFPGIPGRFVVLISGEEVPGTPRGNVKYAKSRPVRAAKL